MKEEGTLTEGTLANAWPAGVMLPERSEVTSEMVMFWPVAVWTFPRMEGTQKVEFEVYWVQSKSLESNRAGSFSV
jgi:hypothetical protein